MKTFKKKLEILITLAILIGVGLYVTGHFDARPEPDKVPSAEIRARLAQAKTPEERFRLIGEVQDHDLMKQLAEQEARKMLRSGDVSAFERAMRENADIARMIGAQP